jgi:undecaprenyl-diphosphatase
MNAYALSLLLGIVEGLTEFLPVSSTGHLRIVEWLCHVNLADEYWKMYSIVIQLGAILCLPVFFRARIAAFLRDFPRGSDGNHTLLNHPLSLTLVATVMTAGPAFVLKKVAGQNLENMSVIGIALVAGGIVMILVDAMRARAEAEGPVADYEAIRTWEMEEMTFGQAVWVGLCQTLAAVFPGTSRSMATIAAGQIAGMSRAAALEFSFFLSMPTMAIATGYDLLKYVKGPEPAAENDAHVVAASVSTPPAHGWIVLAIGFVTSFAVAYATVAWFMAWVRKHGFIPFGIYRLVAGAAVLYWMA